MKSLSRARVELSEEGALALSDRANEILVADAFCLWPRSEQVLC